MSFWAYSVIFSIHWLFSFRMTGAPQRSHTPSTTSSLASTHLQEVHQFHRHGGLIGQAVLVQLEEDPLGPLVVAGVGGVHHPVPVEGVAQHVELAGEVGDVVLGHLGGVNVVLDGEVLSGQAEGVIADGGTARCSRPSAFSGRSTSMAV